MGGPPFLSKGHEARSTYDGISALLLPPRPVPQAAYNGRPAQQAHLADRALPEPGLRTRPAPGRAPTSRPQNGLARYTLLKSPVFNKCGMNAVSMENPVLEEASGGGDGPWSNGIYEALK